MRHTPPSCTATLALLPVLALLGLSLQVAAFDLTLDTTVVRHQNLNKAGYGDDRRHDTSFQLDLGGSWQPAVQTPGLLDFTGDLQLRGYERYSALNQRALLVGARYTQRIGLGPAVPWWQFLAQYHVRDVNDSQRDNHGWWLSFTLGKALTDALDGRLWLAADKQNATGDRDSAMSEAKQGYKVYDLSGWQFGGELTYWFTDQLSVLVYAQYRNGDVVSSSTQEEPMEYAWLMDPVFGMGTYRVGAQVYDAKFGVMYSFTEQLLLSMSYQYLYARSDLPDNYMYRHYRSSNLSVGLHYAF